MAMADMSESSSRTEMARAHIEDIRRQKFSIGQEVPNPLVDDLQNAVLNLSSELYAKDIHFLMELIQNAEDNRYSPGVEPTLEFVLTGKDVTGTGAPATLLVFNNEVGFSKQNVESICSIGRSTKKGQRNKGFIGEKGIGFKSVFLVSAQPYVFSNGYQIKFSESPTQSCQMGYIVPEWVSTKPTISDLQIIYGDKKALPGTVIVLPLKPGKLENVRKHLSDMHPEVLLFLHKIKRLSVRMNGLPDVADSVSEISISNETSISPLQSTLQAGDSRIVRLCSKGSADATQKECCYFIHAQVFPVKPDSTVDTRKDIKEWTVCLAFPFGDRLRSGMTSVGIFSYLPTSMVTNFPFIVQADFILTSSREAIVLDKKWNLGILDYVPAAFVSALTTCIKSTGMAEHFPITRLPEFFPLREAPLKQLNSVRESIKKLLWFEHVVPCQSLSIDEVVFCKPSDVVRLFKTFRNILSNMTEHHVALGKSIMHGSVDTEKYNKAWDFLGVPAAKACYDWHAAYIKMCNLLHASTDVYLDLLHFLAAHWDYLPQDTLSSIPLFKYVVWSNQVFQCSISDIKNEKLQVHLIWEAAEHSWLNKWNVEMQCPGDMFFLHDDDTVNLVSQKSLQSWLAEAVGLKIVNVSSHFSALCTVPKMLPRMAVLLAHFVYHSTLKNYVSESDASRILQSMPVVDETGKVQIQSNNCLVPSSTSKWVKLFGSDKIYCAGYTILGKEYAEAMEVCGLSTRENDLVSFLVKHGKAVDLPDILPLDKSLDVALNRPTKDQSFLLLEWIKNLKSRTVNGYKIPEGFLKSVQNGKWMKTNPGFSKPKRCYLYNGSGSTTLAEIGKAFVVLLAIDEQYYEDKIRSFREELVFIGVQNGTEDMYQVISRRLNKLVSSAMSRDVVVSLLKFIKYSKDNKKLNSCSLKAIQDGKWLKTDQGYVSPVGVAYLPPGTAEAIMRITDLRVVDSTFYGNDLKKFMVELKLLGVLVHLEDIYKLVPQHLQFPEDPTSVAPDSALSLLHCSSSLRQSLGSDHELFRNFMNKLEKSNWIKTHMGYRKPRESLYLEPQWKKCLKETYGPFVDQDFYGPLGATEKAELKAMGAKTGKNDICSSLFEALTSHKETDIIMKIFTFLKQQKWSFVPQGPFQPQLWIPGQPGTEGKWVKNSDCVLHDEGNLFGSSFHILDRLGCYKKHLFPFLSKNLGVDKFPSVSRCVALWNKWDSSRHPVSSEELHSFWELIVHHWDNPSTEEVLKASMFVLPATTASGEIRLVNRADVLIADDLLLKKSFTEAGQDPLFVWFPKNGSFMQQEIYTSLGVRKLSESVKFSLSSDFEKLDSQGNNLIGKPLIKIVLAFLANPLVNMLVEARHERVESLLDISILGTDQPMMVSYVVHLPSSGKKLQFQSEKLVLWDKNSGTLRVHKPSWNGGLKNVEFIAEFARAASEIVLSGSSSRLTDDLRKIIKMGLAFGLKDDDVDSLLRTENLELFDADNSFLECAFSASSGPVWAKHLRASPCTPEMPNSKRTRVDGGYSTRSMSSLNKGNTQD